MPQRSFWKGYMKLSLVTCPVAMMPAHTEGEKVRFHTLNRKTGDRVETRYVDAGTGKVVNDDDEVKGYERGENQYVMLEDDEVVAVALESTHTIDIETFVPKDSIEWVWYDKPHYLTPDDHIVFRRGIRTPFSG
ncbi:DNA end-binding protein Ku [Rhizobiales bacterium GAS113]|nr:DNA end-binding protein Ku [Rhizobiales bacterium GAS113]